MALNPIGGYFRKSYQDFSGGLNTYSSALLVKQNQFTELTNAVINERGILEKGTGYALDGSPFPDDADSFIRMLVEYKRGTSIQRLVCAALDEGNTNVTYKVDIKETSGDGAYTYIGYVTGTATFTNGSPTVTGVGTAFSTHLKAGDKIGLGLNPSVWYEISSPTSATSITLTTNYTAVGAESGVAGQLYKARMVLDKDFIPSATVFNNNLVITNGIDRVMSFNSTTLTGIDTAPKAKFIVNHKSRLFSAATASAPSSIFWSAVNDETVWDATSVEPIFSNDNGNIVGIVSFADSLIVLKDTGSVYQVYGSFDQDAYGEPDFIRRIDVPSNLGSIAGFTAKVGVDNKIYFLAQTGVYSIDSRMYVEKVSWDIKPTTDSIILTSGATSAKSYIYDSKTQWDNGTHSGTIARSDGKLRPFFDKLTITNAGRKNGTLSCAIDSVNNVHIAYRDSVSTDTIRYVKWLALDNTTTEETIVDSAGRVVQGLSIDVNSSDVPGIAWNSSKSDGDKVKFVERTAGAWGSIETAYTDPYSTTSYSYSWTTPETAPYGISLRYRSDNLPRIASCNGQRPYAESLATSIMYCKKAAGGAWTYIYQNDSNHRLTYCCLLLNADGDPRIAATRNGLTGGLPSTADAIFYWSGSGGETALTNITSATIGFAGEYGISLQKNGANFYSSFTENGVVQLRCWDTAVTTTPGTGSTSYLKGYAVSGTTNNFYESRTISSIGTENFLFNATNVSNTGAATTSNYTVGDRGLDYNGAVFSTATFGASANEVIVRRLTSTATYTQNERSDSTLSAWGTYSVAGESSSGNTILHQIALNSITPASSYSTITSGSIVSSDSSLIFEKFKITFTLTGFNASEIDSVTINYTGTGVGPVFPTGIVYNNEYYLANGLTGDAANSNVLVLDRGNAWSTAEYPVSFMARYRDRLYAGSSTSGKVYKLRQDYRAISSAYTLTATTKEDLLGSVELEKEVYKIYVLYEVKSAGTFSFDYRTDNFKTIGGATWVTTSVDQTTAGIAEIPYIGGPFRTMQFRVTSSGLDAQLGIVGFVIMYGYLDVR